MSRFIQPYADVGKGITPNDGAKYWFYESGTSTPKNTYADEALTIPNTNPVISDGNGVFPDIWLEAGAYKVRLTDKNDVQKNPDAENIQSFAMSSRSESFVLDRPTLDSSINDSTLENGMSINMAELLVGGGEGSMWDVVLSSTVVANNENIIQSIAKPSVSIVRRDNTLIGKKLDKGLGDVSILATDSSIPLSNKKNAVEKAQTFNVADPNIIDAPTPGDAAPTPMNTTAEMLHRQRNNLTGVNSAQLPNVVGTFATSRKYDVDGGNQYTISMHGAPLGFEFASTATPKHIQFFNDDGTLHSNHTSGFNNGASGREITFTAPLGANKVAFPIRNSFDFSNVNPMTELALQQCVDNIMMNEGSSAQEFSVYNGGVYAPSPSIFNPDNTDNIIVARQSPYTYIRANAQQSLEKDVVWRVMSDQGFNRDSLVGASGSVDFFGVRFIDKSISSSATISAFNQSSLIHSGGFDEGCPIRINDMFVAGGHGVTSYIGDMAAHGKTNADVGSIWSDGVDSWVLYFINDSDKLTFVRVNTGDTDKWVISSFGFSGLTITHVSGAVNTQTIVLTSSSQNQFRPTFRNYLTELRIDDAPITGDGVYNGKRVTINEIYSLMNMASQQAHLNAAAGTLTPSYDNYEISEQIRFFNEFEWNAFGAMSVRSASSVKDAYRRDSTNYWGAIQLQRLAMSSDSQGGMHDKVYVYIPEVAPVSNIDFQNIADVTSNTLDIYVPKTSCDDPLDPASHFCLFGRDASGVDNLSGQIFGYNREVGLGIPANREVSVNNVFQLSSAEKNYPKAIDSGAGDATAGEYNAITAFRAPFLPTDADLSIPAVIVTMDGSIYCYIAAHKDITRKSVIVPAIYDKWPITVLKSSPNVDVISSYVENNSIIISVTNSYGDIVVKLG